MNGVSRCQASPKMCVGMCVCLCVYVREMGSAEDLKGGGFDFVLKVLDRCINKVLRDHSFRPT